MLLDCLTRTNSLEYVMYVIYKSGQVVAPPMDITIYLAIICQIYWPELKTAQLYVRVKVRNKHLQKKKKKQYGLQRTVWLHNITTLSTKTNHSNLALLSKLTVPNVQSFPGI